MIGMLLTNPESGIAGTVDSESTQPDGKKIVRIEDHWFFADACEAYYDWD